ncbi:hypothetical protein PS15p_200064 [Mucor circinelloides]
MELLNEYANKRGKKRISISDFYKKEQQKIQLLCNQIEPTNRHLDLRLFWEQEINKFEAAHPEMKITKDLYCVDFTDFEVNRAVHLDNTRIKRDVMATRTNAVNKMLDQQDVFQDSSEVLSLTNIVILNKLKTMKQNLKYVHDLHKKDLLYYHIIDLATSSKKQAVRQALDDSQINQYLSDMKVEFKTDQAVVNFIKNIIKASEKKPLVDTLKETKAIIEALPNGTSLTLLKQAVYKMIKICAGAIFAGDNKFSGAWNEVEYTFFFIYPLLKQALHNVPFEFRLGESHLKCAIKNTNDDEAADCGPKIDIIMYYKRLDLAMSVVEVSGPNHKVNKNHYLGDRVKIAKNLKSILKAIEKSTKTPDIITFKKIKVYGVQVYQNQIFIYSLARATDAFCVFLCEKKIDIPTSTGLFRNQILAFLSPLLNLPRLYNEMVSKIDDFLEASSEHDVPSNSNSEVSTPNVSPKKPKQKSSLFQ